MSTLSTTYLKHGSSGINNITLASTGAVAVNGSMTGAGLDLITSQTFSGVVQVNFNNCFTSAYDNYLITATQTTTVDSDLNIRLRSNLVDASGANYTIIILDNGGTVTASRLTSQTQTRIGPTRNGIVMRHSATIFSPYLTVPTSVQSRTTSDTVANMIDGTHNLSTSYDGCTIYAGGGTMSGIIRIYGYKNS